jgi:hypothetical protein
VERRSRREELKAISKQVKVKVVSNYHGRPSLCNRRAVQRNFGAKERRLRMPRFAVAAEKVRPT